MVVSPVREFMLLAWFAEYASKPGKTGISRRMAVRM